MGQSESLLEEGKIFLGKSAAGAECLELKLSNRHGLVTGATGTGKTVSLQVMAEGFSAAGVPVFAADIKGDLSGISAMGEKKDGLVKRAKEIGLDDWSNTSFPTVFWDLFAEQGHPIRATVQEMGPLLLSRLMELNETQEGVLNIIFRVAADEKMPLLDLKDLRALANDVGQRGKSLMTKYGNVSAISVGAIQRRLLVLEEQGAANFFGEPALDIRDFIKTTADGRGTVNILSADKLMKTPRLYATFLLWMLAQLFDKLPEVGDPDKPKLVFFFDEAHLLFNEAPKALLDQVERVTRLIRSKGVGVYYVTQNPRDVPNSVSAQLGNRIQHALRAFTPIEQKGIRAAAETFRPNPALDVERVIQELKVGEALVSVLQKGGEPSMVQRTLIRPPSARIGPITPDQRKALIEASPLFGKYEETVDRDSAYEMLEKRVGEAAAAQEADANSWGNILMGGGGTGRRQGYGETFTKSLVRTVAGSVGRAIAGAIFGRR
ncbi:MAG TPA: helicase HerA-like domain-containing protein [Hyphomicrobiaceae bacterium]|nr:helicase HerA-like domain-containing protein [Hyphomicrobiaceae bacterium]